MTEKEYRALDLDSYSTIKVFLDDRKKYYRKFVLKEKVNENASQENDDMRFGGIVDCLLFTPDEFDERYVVATATQPSGQMGDFVYALYTYTMEAVNEMGDVTRSMADMIQDAYNYVGFKRDKLETVTERFLIKKEGYDYYMELRERGTRLLITTTELDMAHKVVEYLINHPYTRELLNMVSSDRYEIINQRMILGEIDGLPVKMMSDKIVLDKQEHILTPFDLKVMGNIDIFPYNFLKLKYYIQLGVYTTLLRQEYPDYHVNPLRFLTVDKYRYMDPVVIKTSEGDYLNAMNGFTLAGHKYKGLKESIAEIKFHKQNGIWTSSKEAQESKGIVTLKLYEDYASE